MKLSNVLKKQGYSTKDGFRKVAFYMDDVSSSQLSYEILSGLQHKNTLHDISIFVDNLTNPCIFPSCPIYSSRYIRSYTGDLIATSVGTLERIHKAQRARKHLYLYGYDVFKLINYKELINNVDECIWSRSESYQKLLGDRTSVYMPFFDINTIIGNI